MYGQGGSARDGVADAVDLDAFFLGGSEHLFVNSGYGWEPSGGVLLQDVHDERELR